MMWYLRLRSHLVPEHGARERFFMGTNVNTAFISSTQARIRHGARARVQGLDLVLRHWTGDQHIGYPVSENSTILRFGTKCEYSLSRWRSSFWVEFQTNICLLTQSETRTPAFIRDTYRNIETGSSENRFYIRFPFTTVSYVISFLFFFFRNT